MAEDDEKTIKGEDAAASALNYLTDIAGIAFRAQADFARAALTAASAFAPSSASNRGVDEKSRETDAQGERRSLLSLRELARKDLAEREREGREADAIADSLAEAERAGRFPPVDQIEGATIEDGETKVRVTNSPPAPPERRVCLFDFRKFKPPAKSETADTVRDAARKLSRGRPLAGPRNAAAADETIARLYSEFPWFQPVLTDLLTQLRVSAEAGDGAAFRPMLLVGPPGVGKTRFASKLAKALDLHFERHDCAGVDDTRALAGTARGWASAEFAAPVRALLACDHANPMLFLDEIEKGGVRWKHYRPSSLVLPWLESSSASTWRDPLLMAPVDLSQLLWVFGANDLAGLPDPFLSRVSVYEIPTPGPEHFDALYASIAVDIEEADRKYTGPAWSIVTPRSGVDEFDEPERDLIEPEAVAYLRGLWCKLWKRPCDVGFVIALGSSSEHRAPDFRRGLSRGSNFAECELTFPDPMHEFDARDSDRGVSEALEPEHRAQTQLDGAVILFNEIVQVFGRSNARALAALTLRQ